MIIFKYQTLEGNTVIKTELMVNEVNYIDITSDLDVINELTFSPLVKSIPRKQDLKIVIHKNQPDIKWVLQDSSFNEMRDEDEVDIYIYIKT